MPTLATRNAESYYESPGAGRTVVFAHGAGGNASALVLSGTPRGLWTILSRKRSLPWPRVSPARAGSSGRTEPPWACPTGGPTRRGRFTPSKIASFNSGLDPAALSKLVTVRIMADDLAGYDTPTLMLSGDEDVLFPPDALDSVAAALPGARLERFAGLGHSTYFEQPERFNQTVSAFLEAHA